MRQRTAITLILLFAAYSTVFSQPENKSFNFFLQGGLNASQVGGDGLSGFDKLNIAAGIGTERAFSDKFIGRLELNYLQKGSRKVADPQNNDRTEYKMALSYAQVAPLLRYAYNEKLSGIGGLGVGVLLSSEETDFFGEIQGNPDFEPIDFGFILGVQYFLSDRFSAQVRLDQSFIPIRRRGSNLRPDLRGRQYNTVLGIILSYSIH